MRQRLKGESKEATRSKQQQFRGLGFILVYYDDAIDDNNISGQIFTNDDISYQEYLTALADGSVEQVIINQNQQTPTGEVNLFLRMEVQSSTIHRMLLKSSTVCRNWALTIRRRMFRGRTWF